MATPQRTLRVDIETFSEVDLKKAGVHAYAMHSSFEVLLFQYAWDEEPACVVDVAGGEPIPEEVVQALYDPAVLKTAFNAAFEITCLGEWLARTRMADSLDPAQWRCTAVHALYLGLPASLAEVGRVLGLPDDKAKMAAGWSLIRYFCIPCKPTKANGGRTRNRPHHDPAKWALFKAYGARDVEAEREVSRRLSRFPLPASEQRLWVLDQQINARGIGVERRLVHNAITADAAVKKRLVAEAVQITGLRNPNSVQQLIGWLDEAEGLDTEDLKKATVPKLLERAQTDAVKRLLAIRLELAKTSVKKYTAMARAVCPDGRVRGVMQFYGANRTGRWAGRIVQPQNLPGRRLKDLDAARQVLLAGDVDLLELLYGNVPDTLSQLIRTALVAAPGRVYAVSDFNAIEARIAAWIAQETWRLDVFATHGLIYEASAAQMFGLDIEEFLAYKRRGAKHPLRQKGKVAELALGYQGGPGALVTMGALEQGLTEDELPGIVAAWRRASPNIERTWYRLNDAAIFAVGQKSRASIQIGPKSAFLSIDFSYESGMLFVTLPSGRRLAYVKPRLELDEKFGREGVTYEGTDQKTKRWTRLRTYGGKLFENIVQAIARDCLAESMLRLDAAGFPTVLTVHDEIVAEIEDRGAEGNEAQLAEMERLMGLPISWAPGLTLRGDGFLTPYYMKEE